jgi:RNA polymerase sigma-70 factor (ECF subfamily)
LLTFHKEQQIAPGEAELDRLLATLRTDIDYLRSALRRCGVRGSDLDDLVQDVLVVVLRRWGEYDAARPLRPWLAGIAFRVAYHHRARKGRELPTGWIELADETPTAEEHLVSQHARLLLTRALATLTENHQQLLILHEVEGVPVRAVAEQLEIPFFTAHSRLRAARQALARAVRRAQAVDATREELGPLLRLAG